jgi:TRAP-type mannitol/chloroaromatic compound transport system substrate-binding protein
MQRLDRLATGEEGRMRRRRFVAGSAAGAVLGSGALAAPAIAQGRVAWNMVMPWPRNTPGVGVNAQRFVDDVAAMSDGRLAITLYAAGELVPPFEALDAVQQGAADLAHGAPYYWVGKSQALNYFTTIPFGLTATELAAWLEFGEGRPLWEEVYEPFGVVPFYAGSSGVQAGGWFRRPIETVADLNGLKFRIAGLGGEVMRRLGVNVVLLPPGEIQPALSSGAIDGAEWIGPWNDRAFGLFRVAKHYYVPAFHEPGPGLEIIVNRDKYEALPADLQAVLRVAAAAAAHRTLADFTYHNIVSFEPLLAEEGVELHTFSDEIVQALGEKTREVLDELAASDPLTGRVHASFSDFLRQAERYNRVFDRKMLEMRSLVWEG